jgi:alanine racemase
MAVVKANGYGHGTCTIAKAAAAAGAEWLGTTDIAEASELRAAGSTVPILTWLNPPSVDAEAAAADDGPVLNEVNTMPGMTAESQLPRMLAASG